MTTHEYFSDVKDGKLQRNVSAQLAKDLKEFEGKRVLIKITLKRRTRSLKQNAYLHALFTLFKDELNKLGNEFTSQEVKDICKCKFLNSEIANKETGEIIGNRIKHTSELNTMEMSEFIENIISWAADMFHIILPYPSEVLQMDL